MNHEIAAWMKTIYKGLAKSDRDSLGRTMSKYQYTTGNNFEIFRTINFPKVPDMNIFHLMQLLARFDIVDPLPREADRWKFVLNIAIEYHWKDDIKSILQNMTFINMKKYDLSNDEKIVDIFSIYHDSFKRCRDKNESLFSIAQFIAKHEMLKISYISFYNDGKVFAAITYNRDKRKNIVVHRFFVKDQQAYLYDRNFDLIQREDLHFAQCMEIKEIKENEKDDDIFSYFDTEYEVFHGCNQNNSNF